VSRDFELGRKVSCEKSTVSPARAKLFYYYYDNKDSYSTFLQFLALRFRRVCARMGIDSNVPFPDPRIYASCHWLQLEIASWTCYKCEHVNKSDTRKVFVTMIISDFV